MQDEYTSILVPTRLVERIAQYVADYERDPKIAQAIRFWAKVRRGEGCWEWTGAIGTTGYGELTIARRHYQAHRVSYELTNGPIPPGGFIAHRCDNKPCVRPDHLFLTDRAGNMADMYAKGRHAHGPTHGTQTKPGAIARGAYHFMRRHPELIRVGEAASRAKAKEAEVIAIRERYAQGGITQQQLADEHHLTPSAIWAMLRRRSWKHL